MLMGPYLIDCCFLLKKVTALIPIGFPLSKWTIQEFIAVLFLSLLQVVGISIQGYFWWMHFVNDSFSGRDKCGN